jgi:hypothetical protein
MNKVGFFRIGLAGADVAGGAGDVLDIKPLAEMLAELLRHEPRKRVGNAAGRKRNDHPH